MEPERIGAISRRSGQKKLAFVPQPAGWAFSPILGESSRGLLIASPNSGLALWPRQSIPNATNCSANRLRRAARRRDSRKLWLPADGKPPSYVAKYEGGDRRLDVIEFLDVAAAIGFDPCRLIRSLLGK